MANRASVSMFRRLAAALTDGLRRRGVDEPEASLAAEASIAVLRVAFERWIAAPRERDLRRMMRECLDALGAVTRTA